MRIPVAGLMLLALLSFELWALTRWSVPRSWLGNRAFQSGRLSDAEHRFREALDRQPGDALAAFNLGTVLAAEGHHDAAITYLIQAQRRSGATSFAGTAAFNRGTSLAMLGRRDEALGAFREALLLDPGDEDARFNYVLLRRQVSRTARSQQAAGRPPTAMTPDEARRLLQGISGPAVPVGTARQKAPKSRSAVRDR